jgi:hypothetical protein
MNSTQTPTKSTSPISLPEIVSILDHIHDATQEDRFPNHPHTHNYLDAIRSASRRIKILNSQLELFVRQIQKGCDHSFVVIEENGSATENKICTKCKLSVTKERSENFVTCKKCSLPMKNLGIVEACGQNFQKYGCTGHDREHDIMSLV